MKAPLTRKQKVKNMCVEIADRHIRFAGRKRARKAGEWALKKYSGAFKKLAAS